MTVQTIYLLGTAGVTPNFWGNTQLNGSAPTAANSAFGWGPAKTATTTPYYRGRLGATATGTDTAVASSYNAGTSSPTRGTGTGAATAGDSFIVGPLSGVFAATAWTFNCNLRAGTAGAAGHINMRMWRGTNAAGTGATQVTANTAGATVTLSTSADTNSSITWSPGALTLANEYLFFQIEWQETTAGSSNGDTVLFRIGTASITTADYLANNPATLTITESGDTLSSAGVSVQPPITGGIGGGGSTTVVLLVHGDGSITDSSATNNTLTPHGVTTTTTSKFGSGALDFTTGSGYIYVDCGAATPFNFGANPFTVECWCYFLSTPGSACSIITQWLYSGNWSFSFNISGGRFGLVLSPDGVNYYDAPTTVYTPPLNAWVHLAADRDASGMIRCYANGVVLLSISYPTALYPAATNCLIGIDGNGNGTFPGYMDEVRITNGVAQYGGAFTPPTAPFSGGAGALAQADQTLSASGYVYIPPATATLTITQGAQSLSASGIVGTPPAPITGTLTQTQGGQTISATAVSPVTTINIFPALPAWVTATGYTVGQRTGNGGNAYECTTAGTSSGGPSGTGSSIADGTCVWKFLAVAHFTSLASAFGGGGGIAALAPWPFVADTTVQIWRGNSNTINESLVWTPAGISTFTLTITVAAGDSFRDHGSGIPLYYDPTQGLTIDSASPGLYIDLEINCPFIFQGLQSKLIPFAGGEALFASTAAIIVRDCIFEVYTGYASPLTFNTVTPVGTTVYNCLFNTHYSLVAGGTGTTSITLNNNTLLSTVIYSKTLTLRNNIIDTAVNSTSVGTAYNNVVMFSAWSTSGITDGGGNLYNQSAASLFVNPASDFRLLVSSPANDIGATIAGITDDIFRTTRPQGSGYDVGAYEYVTVTGPITGTLTITQGNQTLSGTATDAIVGALGITQANQTLSAIATVRVGGTLTVTQVNQTLAATAAVGVAGSLGINQAANTLSAVGGPLVGATLAQPQANQTLVAAGRVVVGGTLALPQANQTIVAAGSALITATLTQPQAPQTLAATGSVLSGIGGSLFATQASQTLVAAGNVPPAASLALTQAPQTLAALGTVRVAGTLTATQDPQSLAANGLVLSGISGSLNAIQANETLAALGAVSVGAHLALTQAPQTLSASGGVSISGNLTVPQAPNTLSASGGEITVGHVSLTQGPNTLAGAGTIAIGATLALTQDDNRLAAVSSLARVRVLVMA